MNKEEKDLEEELKLEEEDLAEGEMEEEDETEEIEQTEEVDNKSDEFNKLNDSFLRLQADFTNYKRRVEKDKESIYQFANEKLVLELLDVIDNFERAFASASEDEEKEGFYEGVVMVYKQLLEILQKNGLEEIDSKDEKFDPNLHHAVMQEESDDVDEEIIIDVFQKGYKLKNKVIRPSMVKVAK
ncbi:MAG: nucleotide exchange factor GrpE [Senegalia sp. (in: firmicutes)]|uniref:nucleotide exchange factor GrpE n=1 Tax=Senegalia sp. (in: firmicutes) TaxID=1924098 RepID=UPI003F9C2B69